MTPLAPNVGVMFAEDVRREVTGSHSVIGVMQNDYFFKEKSRLLLPKLLVYVTVKWDPERPPEGWELNLEITDKNVVRTKRVPGKLPLFTEREQKRKPDEDTGIASSSYTTKIVPFEAMDGTKVCVKVARGETSQVVGVLRFHKIKSSPKIANKKGADLTA